MNTYYGHHVIVMLENSGNCITLRTLDALHGRSCRMFMDSDALYRWLEQSDGSSFMDFDCGSFVVMHRRNGIVHVHQTWVQSDDRNGICGYTQDFELLVDDLMTVIVANIRIRKLARLGSDCGLSSVTITDGAHRQVKNLDHLHRRALSKGLRDVFRWKGSHVCLYADWDQDFGFVDQCVTGGLCLHETHVVGRDGKLHRKLCYQLHT